MNLRQIDPSYSQGRTKNQAGQILVEYLLILIVGVVIAVGLTRILIKRDAESEQQSGIIVQVWSKMTEAIGQDPSDDLL